MVQTRSSRWFQAALAVVLTCLVSAVVRGSVVESAADRLLVAQPAAPVSWNIALAKLEEIRENRDFSTISMLEKNLAFNVSGHVLHSVFWTNLSPNGGGEPTGELAEVIDSTFGGFSAFRQEMTEAASTIQGSGWALASWEPVAGLLVIQQVQDHQGNHGQGTIPLLAIDAWEHAFYLQYENRKTDFFAAIWNIVNWTDVADRLEAARHTP